MRIALGLEYDGRAFHGWQVQTAHRSVQSVLEAALAQIAGHPVSTVTAGRTDAGVHATGQVVHFDTSANRPESAWVRGVNSHLPDEISVNWACPVSESFHARFSATGRRYRYILLNRPTRPGVLAGKVGWDFHPINSRKTAEAAAKLVGTHDFTAFRAAQCQARSPVRTMTHASVRQVGEYFVFDFSANAFLHHMIRNLVGSLVYVGKGAQSPEWIDELLSQRDRKLAAPTFMADGLYLVGVDYPPEFALPQGGGAIFPWDLPSSEGDIT